jgi:3-deoxy-7-phosphoheptulonate synthase
MIIMEKGATKEQIDDVIAEVKRHGLRVDVSQGEYLTIIGLIGDESKISFANLALMAGVKEARMVETPYKLISRDYSEPFIAKDESRIVKVGDVRIGGDEPVIMAGPCAVESKEQVFRIAKEVKAAGARILRGGIYKPRSSVHSFQGLGSRGEAEAREALEWLRAAGHEYGMPVMTEVRGEYQTELIAEYVDILQIGARNMYDQDLLGRVGRTGKPVLLKRHFGASVEEFLSFSEYIVAEGNKDVILCERGIVPVGKGNSFTRYTLDLGAVPVIKSETYLPVIVDPSHAAGRRDLIFDLSCAAIAIGAHGLVIEAHYNPKEAIVDAKQMITPDELKDVVDASFRISKVVKDYKKKNS